MEEQTKILLEKSKIKDSLQQEFNLTIEQRINRQLELRPHPIIPSTHFAKVSAECFNLYRDGHYYGTISLSQAVAEALVRFICQKNLMRASDDYEENIEVLKKRGLISDNLVVLFSQIWGERNDYHHLNPEIEQDRNKLELLAKEKLTNLKNIEEDLFGYMVNDGKIRPNHLKYWEQTAETIPTYIRFD